MTTPALTFDVKRGMYGECTRIIGRLGLAGEEFAEAFFSHIEQKWDVVVNDGKETTYSIDVSDREAGIDQVKALMNLTYRASLPKAETAKVAARYLSKGDQVGSGETVVNVAAGVRTPRGKVEVTLEKDGNRRCAIWGASTVITVRRAA